MKENTKSQNIAINTDAATVACVAGPGSGKTSVLVARVARLLAGGADPALIAVMTFTNAAARELERRLNDSRTVDDGDVRLGYCGTLHAFALRALRDHGAAIGYGPRLSVLDEEGAGEMLAAKARTLGCRTPVKRLLELKSAGRPARGVSLSVEQTVVAAYYDELLENGMVDLECLLPEFLRLLDRPDCREGMAYEHLLVDEVQDASAQDWAIYDALPARRKFFVGDPDQAIYSFRGGRQDLFLRLIRSSVARVNVIPLEENFRCGRAVCAAANALIGRNVNRAPKDTIARLGAPDGIVTACGYETEGEEVGQVLTRIRALMTPPDGVDPSQIAVLARTNAIAAPFRDALKAAGVQVAEAPRNAAPPDWGLARALVELLASPGNDALAFFYVAARERQRGASEKEAAAKAHSVRQDAARARKSVNALWFNLPRSPALVEVARLMEREGLTAETRAKVNAIAQALPAGSGVLELAADMALTRLLPVEHSAGVHVGTVHGAKGREWDHVFLVGYEDEVTPGNALSVEVAEEERRVAFVGLTRARVGAHFTHSAQRRATWGRQEVLNRTPSRFIAEALQ